MDRTEEYVGFMLDDASRFFLCLSYRGLWLGRILVWIAHRHSNCFSLYAFAALHKVNLLTLLIIQTSFRLLGGGTTFVDTAWGVIYDVRYWLLSIIFAGIAISFSLGAFYKSDRVTHELKHISYRFLHRLSCCNIDILNFTMFSIRW